MASDIVLGSSIRNNLLNLVNVQRLVDQTSLRLATGLEVNSALDDPQNFFTAQALNNRAGDLTRLLDGLGQNIQTIRAAENGIESLSELVIQAQAIADEAVELNRQYQPEARAVGNVDLGPGDLTALNGINNGDLIQLIIRDKDNTTLVIRTPVDITINTGDTAHQIAAEINTAINGVLVDPIIDASVNNAGQLEIAALNDNILHVEFTSSLGTVPAAEALAQALGFGDIARTLTDGLSPFAEVQFSIVPGRQIESFQLYSSVTGRIAQRSDSIAQLEASNGGLLFFGLDSLADTFGVGINGETPTTFTLDNNLTVQQFLDRINSDDTINKLIQADFEDNEGRIIIRAIDSSVQSIDTTLTSNAIAVSFFGFNVNLPLFFLGPDQDTIHLDTGDPAPLEEIERLENDFNSVREQINRITQDAQYRGINLLDGEQIVSIFNENGTSTLTIEGINFTASGLGVIEADFSSLESSELGSEQARTALLAIRQYTQSLANELSIIQSRETFTRELINTLKAGRDDLIVADANEEGANLLAAQTRQSVAVSVLALLGQQNNAILRLF